MVELLLVTTIVAILTSATLILLNPARAIFQLQPEMADMQQRMRVGLDALQRDLLAAGAGLDWGEAAGPLVRALPPVLPFRIGTRDADRSRGVSYRPDVISVVYVPSSPAQCRLRDWIADGGSPISVEPVPGCPPADPLCGFQEGQQAIVFDGRGRWDVFRVTGSDPSTGWVFHATDPLVNWYEKGAALAEVVTRTYWVRRDGAEASLSRYDGYKTDVEITDHVADFRLEYFGEAEPPRLLPGFPEDAARTSYGPAPPPAGVDDRAEVWPAGENCLFARDPETGAPRSRLARLNATDGSLALLPAASLGDGPWCPDAFAPNRFDADLFRVRRVRVTLRIRSALGLLVGSGGLRLWSGGDQAHTQRLLPDREIRLDVSPRNLNLGR
ncbi:MAG: hypothetical protein HYS05_13805 [Acidobacteria bacterium]|nr:hypothetical protein [Acidobacteriota bacterium]